MDNRKQKEEEKTLKYAPLRLELKRQHPGYKIRQFNIVIDALGGYSRNLKEEVKTLVSSDRYREVLDQKNAESRPEPHPSYRKNTPSHVLATWTPLGR